MDWNNDGKLDILSGDTRGQVWLFLNQGTPTRPKLASGVRITSNGKPITGRTIKLNDGSGNSISPQSLMGYYSKIHWADYNGDSLNDLLVGQTCDTKPGARIIVYPNIGSAHKPKLSTPQIITLSGQMSRPSPYLADLDNDGLKDMICGTDGRDIVFFKNTGTAQKPTWGQPVKLELQGPGFEKGYRRRLTVTDWNEDGKPDLLMGDRFRIDKNNQGGHLWLFLGK